MQIKHALSAALIAAVEQFGVRLCLGVALLAVIVTGLAVA